MLTRARAAWRTYPPQFWLLIVGMLVSTIGTSMVWPFLTIYIRQTLNCPPDHHRRVDHPLLGIA